MNRWAIVFDVAMALALWAAHPQAWAQAPPELMNYQGTLFNSGGQRAETGTYALQFRIWSAATGGGELWGPEVFDGVAGTGHDSLVNVVDGAFNVVLGPLDTSGRSLINIVSEGQAYLEIAVQDPAKKAYTWLAPRQQILSTPFAFRASEADEAGVIDGLDSEALLNADRLSAGTLSTDRFSAKADLTAEGVLDNNAGADLLTRAQADARFINEGQANSITTAMIGDGAIQSTDIGDGAGSLLDSDLLDGQEGAFYRNATNLNAGTLATDRFSALADLTAEGALDNNAGADLLTRAQADARFINEGQASSVTSAMISDGGVAPVDLQDGAALAEILDNDGAGSALDADLLDGQHGAFYQDAGNVNAGALSTDRYSAHEDLKAESKIGMGFDLVAPGDHMGHGSTNTASGGGAAIGGGNNNIASGIYAAIGGGSGNTAGNNAAVGGGDANEASGSMAAIGGGQNNVASDTTSAVAGGAGNTASGTSSAVGGGGGNVSSEYYATVPGGLYNRAAGYCAFAAGRQAKSDHDGAFVWADSKGIDLTSDRADQFKVRAGGGVYLQDGGSSSHLNPAVLKVESTSSTGVAVHAIQSSSDATLVVGNSWTGDLIKAFAGDGFSNLRFRVDNAGEVWADGAFNGGGADFAEYLPKRDTAEALEPGDVVGMFAEGVSKRTDGAQRLLVITTKPLILGNAPDDSEKNRYAPVAMVGQVPVKVRGPVHAGDYLVASGDDGTARAMATVPAGLLSLVAGQALESSQELGVKTVRASVGVSRDGLWAQALQERDERIAVLEHELETLKTAVAALAAR